MFMSPHTSGCAGGVSGTWGSARLSSCEWSSPGQATVGPTAKARAAPSPRVRVIARMQVDQVVLQTSLLSEVEGRDGNRAGYLYIYQVSQLIDGWQNVALYCSMEESLPLEFRYFFTAEVSCDDPHPPTKWFFEGRSAKASLTSTVYGFIHLPNQNIDVYPINQHAYLTRPTTVN
jgi:hypothetical protein